MVDLLKMAEEEQEVEEHVHAMELMVGDWLVEPLVPSVAKVRV